VLRAVPPAGWFALLLLAGWGLERLRPWPIPLASFGWRLATGMALFGAATLLAGTALRLFAARGTSYAPFAQPTSLITSGPYRFSRNPLYVALVATLIGFASLLASFWLLIAAALLLVALDRLVVPSEEAALAAVFGEEWAAYVRRVRRWL